MGFWEKHAAAEQARRDEWLDVPPATCALCTETKRTVLLGVCASCLRTWEVRHERPDIQRG